jgi:hypothetical protein
MDNVRAQIAMMRTADGTAGVELTRHERPAAVGAEPHSEPVNASGIVRICSRWTTCFRGGPEGILPGLAQQLT